MATARERTPAAEWAEDVVLPSIDRFCYRNRHVIGPPATAVGITVTGLLLGAVGYAWIVDIIAGIGLVCGIDKTHDLGPRREKAYCLTSFAAAAAWTVILAYVGLNHLLLYAGAVALMILAVPFTLHNRVRRGVKVDRAIAAWGDGNPVGLPGTHVRGTKAGKDWFSFLVSADEPGRYTRANYQQARARIAALFKVRSNDVTTGRINHEGELELTIRTEPREAIAHEVSTEARSIIGPESIGETDNGDELPFAMHLKGRGGLHAGIVGLTGSGKSSLVNTAAERVVRAPDAILCMVDLSPGAKELRAWAPVCDWFASSVAEAERLFEWLAAVCEERGRSDEERLFVPDETHPHIAVWVDEAATMFAPDLVPADAETGDRQSAKRVAKVRTEKIEQGVRLYRKYGISLAMATQYGDVEALGGPTTQKQLIGGYTAIFRCAKNDDAWRVVSASKGVLASELPADRPGSLYLSGVTIDGVVQGRIRYMDDAAITKTVETWRDRQPQPEPELCALPGYAERQREPPAARGRTVPLTKPARATQPAQAQLVPRRMPSPQESRQLVLDVLRAFPAGASVAEVSEACDKGASLVKTRLGELKAAGLVTKHGHGQGTWWVAERDNSGTNPANKASTNRDDGDNKPPIRRQ